MQESTKKLLLFLQPTFIMISNVYIMPKEIPENKPKLFDTVSQTHNTHIYTTYFPAYSYRSTTIYRKYANFIHILLVFSYIYCNFATTNE